MASELTRRVAVAAVGIPVALGAAWLGGAALGLLLAVAAGLAAAELNRISRAGGVPPLPGLAVGGAVLLVALAVLDPGGGPDGAGQGIFIGLLALVALSSAIWRSGVDGRPLAATAITVLGALYCGGLLAHALFLRHLPGVTTATEGLLVVALPVVLTWSSDTFAYFTGRRFGRRKLIPSVSPGKTVEGAVGGVIGAMLVAAIFCTLAAGRPYIPGPLVGALLGLLVAVAAQVGDLAESLLKREAGVKDSGTLLPGHGGALDRLDSLFFTLPVAYYFLLLSGV
jgi:phosphatidate cytidylyltransferase